MKGLLSLVGIALIIFGIGVLGYKGFTYTTQENVAEIGTLKVTAETEKTIYFHPATGGLCLIAGVVLLIVARKKMG
jgi:hypothetical protein